MANLQKDAPRKRILVVDDESVTRKNVSDSLREQGYEVSEAEDGLHALELLDTDRFELVISDILMPRLNGFSILESIRTVSPPPRVLLMTGHTDLLSKDLVGNVPCFTKPFQLKDLLSKVEDLLA
jgi:CheY-like chemotaxis protein